MRRRLPLFTLVAVFLPLCSSHVSLSFPAARYPPLDFLDTFRTISPCGVPPPIHHSSTTLVVGETYNFTWRMQYPHQGGYRLTLLDSEGRSVDQLAPLNGAEFAGLMDQTSVSERVKFTQPCQRCTVLLERQAAEWGKSYTFHSCADVQIVDVPSEAPECTGHGVRRNELCECDAGYAGDVCQYYAHCQSDADCQNAGKCLSEENSLVVKSCFCPYGFFGRNCESQFSGEPDECFSHERVNSAAFPDYGLFNRRCYQSTRLTDQDFIYHRAVKDEVEIILDFLTTSWVGLGWRPDGLDPSCRLFPDLEGVRVRRSAADDLSPLYPSEEGITKRESETLSSGPSSSSLRNPSSASYPPSRIAQEGPKPVMPKNNGILASTLEAPLHSMDCVDVIVGSVREGRLRIQDMYSRDRSTPLEDYWYDGMDSLTAAAGIEVDGRTVIMLRRPKQEIEPTDHPLGGSRQFVIWAKGQTAPPSESTSSFYRDDFLGYHGGKNRGSLKVDLASQVAEPKTEIAFGVMNTEQELLPLSASGQPPVIILAASSSSSPPSSTSLSPLTDSEHLSISHDMADSSSSFIRLPLPFLLFLLMI